MSADVIAAAPNPTAQPLPPEVESRTHAWKSGKDGAFGFHDLLDAINPLQHIPIVSAIYRRLTGDVPGNVAQLAGDTLFGGPIGLGVGLFGLAFKEETGKDPGEMALALVTGADAGGKQVAAPPAAATSAATTANQTAAPGAAVAGADSTADATAAASAAADAAPAPATAQQAANTDPAPVMPAHQPMPLHRAPAAAAAPSAEPGNGGAAESAFLAQSALVQRSLTGSRAASASPRTVTAPIPLQLSGQASQVRPFRPAPRTPFRAPAPAQAPASAPTPAASALSAPSAVTAPQSPPNDLAQRMQAALDKYQRLEAQRPAAVDLRQ
jgi:hypothetical protein